MCLFVVVFSHTLMIPENLQIVKYMFNSYKPGILYVGHRQTV